MATMTRPARGRPTASLRERVEGLPWDALRAELDARGFALTPPLLRAAECRELAGLFEDGRFRTTIDMARHGFGRGRYRYFDHPLPEAIAALRDGFYPHLAPIANGWSDLLGGPADDWPLRHDELLARCRAAGQTRPTPLILRYEEGDWNALHQDLYGEHVFPLQVAILLSEPEKDFTGGEFVLTEQRPRMQSRAEVVPLRRGDGVVFAVHNRPVRGTRGVYRVTLRHGVSRLRSGHRHTVGVIFHDAK